MYMYIYSVVQNVCTNIVHVVCVQSFYEQALERCKQEAIQDETYYNGLAVTTTYNMGRLHEALSEFEAAENYYKIILKVKALLLYSLCVN